MFGNLRTKVLKRKLQSVKEGIIELEASILFHQGILDYEGDTLSEDQKKQYQLAIKSSQDQIKTNNNYIRYIEPLL